MHYLYNGLSVCMRSVDIVQYEILPALARWYNWYQSFSKANPKQVNCFGYIGVGRYRILGRAKEGGAKSQQAHDVASRSFRHRVPTRFLINQCQIITFLILKYDIIENSRIELRGIVLPVQVGGLLGGGGGGGGPKGMLAPLSNYWGAWPPLAPPSSYGHGIALLLP